MITILIFLIILGLLIFVHELGHFIAARALGVKVDEFGFGFPPRVWSVKGKKTVYSINWIPLGGYVKLHGEDGQSRDKESFTSQQAWKRIIILVAGVSMNIILAAVIFSFGFVIGLPTDISGGVPTGAKVRNPQVQILEVSKNSAAAGANLQVGDVLVSINGIKINSIKTAQEITKNAGENIISLQYERSHKVISTDVKLQKLASSDQAGLGVGLAETGLVSFSLPRAIYQGSSATIRSLGMIVTAFGSIIGDLFSQQKVSVDVAGPVGIAILTGQVVKLGFAYLLQFAALLSLNLAIINVLPIPALDGGRLLFVIIEKVRGRPVSPTVEAKIHNTSFAILMGLIVLVTFRDIFKIDFVQNIWSKIF